MPSFQDTENRTWHVVLNFRDYRRLKADGFDAADFGQIERLAADPDLAINVLLQLCGGQLAERELSQDDFEAAFDLEVLEHALEAVVEAIIDFFPSQRRRVLRETWERVTSKAKTMVSKQLQEISEQINSGELDKSIETLLSEQLSNSPES